MARMLVAALWVAVAVAAPIAADDVYLKNGETFEGVIARLDGEQVRIRLEFGELALPASTVDRIEASRSPLADYLAKRSHLTETGAPAAEWMELARWAEARELAHGYRESLHRAAEIDPHLESLKPAMRRLDYIFEAELDRWIPSAEHMRRAGMVLHKGEWVRAEILRAALEERKRQVDAEIEQVLARTAETLARAQLERESRETEEARTHHVPAGPHTFYGYPVAYYGGVLVIPGAPDSGAPEPATPGTGFDGAGRRPPGSLLPTGRANGGRFRPPGSLLPARGY